MISTHNHSKGMNIRTKLLFGFIIVILLVVSAIMLDLYKINSIDDVSSDIIHNQLQQYDDLIDYRSSIYASLAFARAYALINDTSIRDDLNEVWKQIETLQSKLNSSIQKTNDKNFLTQWQAILPLVTQLKSVEYQLLQAQGPDKLRFAQQTRDINVQLIDILEGKKDLNGQHIGGLLEQASSKLTLGLNNILDSLKYLRMIQYGLMIILFILSLGIAYLTANSITKPLNYAIDIAKNIASGNKNNEIKIISSDETGELLVALDVMQDAIRVNEQKIKESEEATKVLNDEIIKTAQSYSEHSSKVSSGNLTGKIEIKSDSVMSQLGSDLNAMTENLRSISMQINEASQNMVTSLQEVKQAVDSQTTGATEQASSVNEITASIEEIEKSTNQTMEKAKRLGDAAEVTKEKGRLGLVAVEKSIAGMKNIREKVEAIAQTILDLSKQTQQVGEITSVVTNIAQQSKMLALNASIEAAKAGDAGKGFAVVATEVRNLAEQSENSTSQVQKILEDIRQATEKAVMVTEEGTKGVDDGSDLVMQTGDIIKDLTNVIHETTVASEQIEAAVRQESVGIEQITVGMNEINQVTSAYVSSSKQTMEAINNLAKVAKSLKERVDTYKL